MIGRMARPLVLAACLVLGLARTAAAGGPGGPGGPGVKTSKVTIETDPPGAKVYFNVKEDGEVCTTPCTIDAPIGETPIIVEAENRRSIIENLVVPKKTTRPLRVSYKLKPALGTLVIEGSTGAAITLDDEDQGTAPRRFEDILAGAHHVVLHKDGKKLYDAFIEVEIGREASVTAPALAAAAPPPVAHPAGELPALGVTREAPARAPRRSPEIAISAASDVGWRQFTFNYRTPTTPRTQQNDREGGEILTGAIVELWPTTLLHLGYLPGLELYGRFEIGVNPQHVTLRDTMGKITGTSLDTAWRSLEISLRQRWVVADLAGLEVGAGYTDDRYQFTYQDPINGPADHGVVPDASYRAVRIGARASLVAGSFEPYAAVDNRIVLSGGDVGTRYKLGSSAVGYHGALGTAVHLGPFEVRAEGGITLYSWTLRPDSGALDQADSASDVIEQVGVSVGYVY
jgi:hypothetical protein